MMKNSPLADTVERVVCVYRHFREWTESMHYRIISSESTRCVLFYLNAINLFIVLMSMDKWNICACGKRVDAHRCSGQ